MRLFLFLSFLINLFLLSSCKKYVPADAVFFIQPKLVSVSTNTSTQGSGSSKITDLWLYVDGQFQGAYPSGSRMPIITKNQKVKVNILPGIKNNGISGTRLSWAFYSGIELDTLVGNGQTVDRPLVFQYNPNTVFEWTENFDGFGYSLVKSIGDVSGGNTSTSDTMWKLAPTVDCFEGKSAEIGLSSNASVGATAQFESSIDHTMPQGNTNVYLEINYKGNQVFEVGVLADATTKSTVFVNPSANWNKIYIQLSDALNRLPKEPQQKVYFKMVKTADNATPKIFLDNIKLVHF